MPNSFLRHLKVSAAALALILVGCAPSATTTEGQVAFSPACSGPEQLVSVPDEAVENAMRSKLRLSSATDLSCHALAGLQMLTVRGASDLEGLQFANNLTTLTLEESHLSELSALSASGSLRTLVVRGGNLTSFEDLAGASRLTRLEITDNDIGDIGGVVRLPRLTTLILNGNAVGDISPLAQLDELFWLELNDNRVEDLTPLASVQGLRMLKLNDNQVEDASPLADLPNLGWIELAGNRLDSMEFVSNLRIERLDLSGNRIRSASPLATSLSLASAGYFNLRENCIDLSDPFVQDLLVRGLNVELEPQAECAAAVH